MRRRRIRGFLRWQRDGQGVKSADHQATAPRFPADVQDLRESLDLSTDGIADDELEDIGNRFASLRSRLLELDGVTARRVDNIPGGLDRHAQRRGGKT